MNEKKSWVVWIDNRGWHCSEAYLAGYEASAMLREGSFYQRNPDHRPFTVYALEAPNRYQAIKLSKADFYKKFQSDRRLVCPSPLYPARLAK